MLLFDRAKLSRRSKKRHGTCYLAAKNGHTVFCATERKKHGKGFRYEGAAQDRAEDDVARIAIPPGADPIGGAAVVNE